MLTGNRPPVQGTLPIEYTDKWEVSANNGVSWNQIASGLTLSEELRVAHQGKLLRFGTLGTNGAGSSEWAYSPAITLAVVDAPNVNKPVIPAISYTLTLGTITPSTPSTAVIGTLSSVPVGVSRSVNGDFVLQADGRTVLRGLAPVVVGTPAQILVTDSPTTTGIYKGADPVTYMVSTPVIAASTTTPTNPTPETPKPVIPGITFTRTLTSVDPASPPATIIGLFSAVPAGVIRTFTGNLNMSTDKVYVIRGTNTLQFDSLATLTVTDSPSAGGQFAGADPVVFALDIPVVSAPPVEEPDPETVPIPAITYTSLTGTVAADAPEATVIGQLSAVPAGVTRTYTGTLKLSDDNRNVIRGTQAQTPGTPGTLNVTDTPTAGSPQHAGATPVTYALSVNMGPNEFPLASKQGIQLLMTQTPSRRGFTNQPYVLNAEGTRVVAWTDQDVTAVSGIGQPVDAQRPTIRTADVYGVNHFGDRPAMFFDGASKQYLMSPAGAFNLTDRNLLMVETLLISDSPEVYHGHIVSVLFDDAVAPNDFYYDQPLLGFGIGRRPQDGTISVYYKKADGGNALAGAVAVPNNLPGIISLTSKESTGMAQLRFTSKNGSIVGPEFPFPTQFVNRPGTITWGAAVRRSDPQGTISPSNGTPSNMFRGWIADYIFTTKPADEFFYVDEIAKLMKFPSNLQNIAGVPSGGTGTTPTNPTTPVEPTNPTTPSPTGALPEGLDTTAWTTTNSIGFPTTFQVENFATSPSPGFIRFGHLFGRGDVPAGSIPVVTRDGNPVDVQWDSQSYWLNGDLMFAVGKLRDTQFPASTTRTYTLNKATGTYNNTGSKTVTDITNAHDFKVEFNGMTATDNTTTAQVGSGNFTARLNDQIAVATRREKIASGSVNEGWVCWGMAKDNSGGAEDAHLKTNWHIDIWKNGDGSTYGYEVAAEPAQDWWKAAGKKRRTYDAHLKNGANTIESYLATAHHYHSRWLTCVKTGLNRGRRFWVGGAAPTLVYKPNKAYWVKTDLICPYDPDFVPNAYPEANSLTYKPMVSFNHRAAIDGTGAYEGRGMNTNPDVHAFMRQTAADMACARINAFAGLHVHFHYRSDFMRTRSGETSDIANTTMPFKFNVGLGPSIPFDFQSDGMPAPGGAYRDYRSSSSADGKNGYTEQTGGRGPWSTATDDSSHMCNYSGMMYMLEGERYFLEAVMDLASNTCHQGIDNFYSARPYPPMRSVTGVTGAGGQWDAIAVNGQQRNTGFALAAIAFAAAITPQNHVAKKYFRRFSQQQGRFLKHYLDFMTQDIADAGPHLNSDDHIVNALEMSPWMAAMSAIGVRLAANMTENGYTSRYADLIAKPAIRMGTKGIYKAGSYRCDFLRATVRHHPTTNPFKIDYSLRGGGTLSGANNTLTLSTDDFLNAQGGWDTLKNGDEIFFFYVASGAVNAIPQQTGKAYYAVNVTARGVCQVAATPGGAAIDIPADAGCFVSILPQWADDYTTTRFPPRLWNPDDYGPMHYCIIQMAKRAGNPAVTDAVLNRWNTFVAPINNSSWVTWKMKA